MANLVIAAVCALVLFGDAILLQNKKVTMGHGQHKKTKRARSFKDGNFTAPLKALSPMSASDVNATVARANQQVNAQIAELLVKSNATKAVKAEVSKLLGLKSVEESVEVLKRNSKFDPHHSHDNQRIEEGIVQEGPLKGEAIRRANEMFGGTPDDPSPIADAMDLVYWRFLSDDQVGWLMKNGYIDEYMRFSDKFMNPLQSAMYHFFLNTIPANDNVLGTKFAVISVFCSFFNIRSCPFLPGQGKTEQIENLMKYDDFLNDGGRGSVIQTPYFEENLLKLVRFFESQAEPPILRTMAPTYQYMDQVYKQVPKEVIDGIKAANNIPQYTPPAPPPLPAVTLPPIPKEFQIPDKITIPPPPKLPGHALLQQELNAWEKEMEQKAHRQQYLPWE
jgi:hypothetical protein